MGGVRKAGITRRPVASGSEWAAFRRRLFSWEIWGPSPDCAACGHVILPGRGEVQHQVPPSVNAALAYSVANVRAVHGSSYRDKRGNRRCPECDLACNAILAGNHAPRLADGTPLLPWPLDFLARKRAERAAYVSTGTRAGHGRPATGKLEFTRPAVPGTDTSRDASKCEHGTGPGRCFLCMTPGNVQATVRAHVQAKAGPLVPGSAEWLAEREARIAKVLGAGS